MRWRCGAGQSSTGGWPRLRVTGRAFLVLAFWLLVAPVQWVGASMAAACIHELGHLAAMWMCGTRVLGMEIDAFGAKIETGPMEPKEELLCGIAGPLAGALVCLFWRWMPRIALCAAVQTVFNLLPLFPLDGGRALRAARNISCKAEGNGL